MKALLASSALLITVVLTATETAQAAAPEPANRVRQKSGWFSKLLPAKKRRPPVLPYERALRRNELFRS
ncbi:hypothetical protein HNQ93_003034 [Hymenobacter luteus]|uniref:Uncharacterized protein n=2 Tax=Hymenobacter TaxID=89966 RepID=A0A7W9T3P2_9BACT|nr:MULTISPECIES: hypothetical protein [Hymenobacter]MBB4603270.1 hypothetical protein [Hymenobacter latericoloratus]MBB6060168.1 hypothetical protein [Hymenobacter luteus]